MFLNKTELFVVEILSYSLNNVFFYIDFFSMSNWKEMKTWKK